MVSVMVVCVCVEDRVERGKEKNLNWILSNPKHAHYLGAVSLRVLTPKTI